MSLSPLRFLHAADVFLDRPISRVPAVQTAVSPDVIEAVENATRIAFERVIDKAIEQQVDFVLLGGNTFDEAQRSLSARVALLDGLDQLAADDIRVFVVPGATDPSAAWRAIPDLPNNVTIFFDQDSEPVAVLRDGKVVATVVASATVPSCPPPNHLSDHALRSEAVRRTPFSVILLTQADAREVDPNFNSAAETHSQTNLESTDALLNAATDYVALCTGPARRTVALKSGIAHYPGATQGLSPRQTGPRGCTLVDVEPDGTIHCHFVPTAAVVWEQYNVDIHAATTEQELSEQMRNPGGDDGADSSATPRIVQWTVRGSGTLWESLWDPETRRRFLERHNERTGDEQTVPVLHDLRLLTKVDPAVLSGAEDSLAVDFFKAIDRDARHPREVMERCLENASLHDPEWTRCLRTLIPQLDHEAVFTNVHRLGASWFRSTAGGGRAS